MQQGRVGGDDRPVGQSERGDQVVVEDAEGVAELRARQFQLGEQQFIARHVVLEHDALRAACPHVTERPLCQFDVTVVDLQQVLLLEEVEVVAQGEEADLVAVGGERLPCTFRLEPAEGDCAVERPSGIDDLSHLEGEVVAPVGHGRFHPTAQVAVDEASVAEKAPGEGRVDVRQACPLRRLDGLSGFGDTGDGRAQRLAVAVGERKELFESQGVPGVCLGIRQRRTQHQRERCREQRTFLHCRKCVRMRCEECPGRGVSVCPC